MIEVKLVSLPGDGIGQEVVEAAHSVLDAAGQLWDVHFNVERVVAGAARYAQTGIVYAQSDFDICHAADAVLLGALGLPEVVSSDGTEVGASLMFRLRFDLDLYAGVRPVRRYRSVAGPLRQDELFEFTVIRENTEGLYASHGGGAVLKDRVATDTIVMTALGVDRISQFAFEWALAHPPAGRTPHVTCVDKANVLRSYAFFRSRFDSVARDYQGRVDSGRVYVDAFCAQMVLRPDTIHVAVAENMFGDIISDLAGALVGSLGLAPSADIGAQHGVFQPSHGSAPTIAGKGMANPVATILSAAMMLDWLAKRWDSPQLMGMSADILGAVDRALAAPTLLTSDLGGPASTTSCTAGIVASLSGPERTLAAGP